MKHLILYDLIMIQTDSCTNYSTKLCLLSTNKSQETLLPYAYGRGQQKIMYTLVEVHNQNTTCQMNHDWYEKFHNWYNKDNTTDKVLVTQQP